MLFVATIPVPASPSAGHINAPALSVALGSKSLAPSSLKVPAFSPAKSTLGKMSLIFQSNCLTVSRFENFSSISWL